MCLIRRAVVENPFVEVVFQRFIEVQFPGVVRVARVGLGRRDNYRVIDPDALSAI